MTYSSIELSAYRLQAGTGLTPAEILALPTDEYARLTHRSTIGEIAAMAAEPPGIPRQEPAPAQAPQAAPQAPESGPQGIDISQLSAEQYAQVRGQLGMGRSQKEGRGIFDSVGSASEEYTAAVRAQSGRTGWNTSNVVESPRVNRIFVQPDPVPEHQSARDRFSTPGNVYGA